MNKVLVGMGFTLAASVAAAVDFTITDGKDSARTYDFTKTAGSSVVTSNGFYVFEGEINSALLSVGKSEGNQSVLQICAQVKLFDELPLVSDVTTSSVIGAIAALRDEGENATTGKFYAWGYDTTGLTNRWILLQQASPDTPGAVVNYPVTQGTAKYITLVFSGFGSGAAGAGMSLLDTGASQGSISYKVFVNDTATINSNGAVSYEKASQDIPTSNSSGAVSGVSLYGQGGLLQTPAGGLTTAAGNQTILSASVGFSVYATLGGFKFLLDMTDPAQVSGATVYVKAWIDGQWVIVGSAEANSSGSYEILSTSDLLRLGGTYKFAVVDESGYTHELDNVTIGGTKMDSVTMNADTMLIRFNSVANSRYQVEVSTDFVTWKNATFADDASADGIVTATGDSTTVKIQIDGISGKKAFFRVKLLD
jgi:hypothetical protein